MNLQKLVAKSADEIARGKSHSLFALTKTIILPKFNPQTGNHAYAPNLDLKRKFNRYMADEEFAKENYTDIYSGPFNETNNSSHWANEISQVLINKNPENVVFYMRDEEKIVAARVLISIPDFYGGLTSEEIEAKYPQDLLKKMDEYLRGITVSKDANGKIRIPYSDLSYAYRKATGQKTHPEEWD